MIYLMKRAYSEVVVAVIHTQEDFSAQNMVKGIYTAYAFNIAMTIGFVTYFYGSYRISYSVYHLEHLLQVCTKSSNVDVKVMYDIGCILSSHLQVCRMVTSIKKMIQFNLF